LFAIAELKDSSIRSTCKERIEAVEHWLRRLIDDQLAKAYGDYFTFTDPDGNRLLRKALVEKIEARCGLEPARYPRKVDAILLEDSIDIICKEQLFGIHFKDALAGAFPDGRVEARTFMARLLAPRNSLAHANPISIRQAEQVICYSNDIIDSLKKFYTAQGMNEDFNVPLILRVSDSFGNSSSRNQLSRGNGGILMNYRDRKECFLRPGDVLAIEVEVDPSFEPSEYTIKWSSAKGMSPIPDGLKAVIPITNRQVGEEIDVQCRVISNRDWHRMNGIDDLLIVWFKVLPPLS
jgi:hypothetical protein